METPASISGEKFDHKVAAVFENESSAKTAADMVRSISSLQGGQVFVVGPNDDHPGWELEPEDRGIWRTMLVSHVWLGLAGLVAGLIFFTVLYAAGVMFIAANAVTAAVICTVFGGVLGLMLGGLVTLRPDHMPYITAAQTALREGKYVVAVHATSAEQLREASHVLDELSSKSIRSL